jgi:hypothetical protein
VPYGHDDQRAAWLAGWQWAASHPTAEHMVDTGRGDRRARLARGARQGITGLVLVAAARWWWRRRDSRTGPESSLGAMNDAEP